jgi:hypothetical protein
MQTASPRANELRMESNPVQLFSIRHLYAPEVPDVRDKVRLVPDHLAVPLEREDIRG